MTEHTPRTTAGRPLPLGSTWQDDGINFSLFCRHGRRVELVYRYLDSLRTHQLVLDPSINRTGDIWHIHLQTEGRPIYYGYRVESDHRGDGFPFDSSDVIALDPYCTVHKPRSWGEGSEAGVAPVCLAGGGSDFDWQGDRLLKIPASETIIYELHVRGFTRHPSSAVSAPGTFLGIIEKIPYFQELGITAVELLPVTEWDETDNKFFNPDTGAPLLNYWGYNPLTFFPLRSGLAAQPEEAVNEFKTMVRSLHQAGIEVILDLVYNHTAESDVEGTITGFRAVDNSIYYLIDEEIPDYLNFTGCGNTVNCNHPVVARMIIDSLNFFVSEYHIDGFRFDLAAIFSRDTSGRPMEDSPLIQMITEDPLLRDCKIIAEAWDASGLYQVGSFSEDKRWMEWNGKFRDDIRAFMSGRPDSVRKLATRIAGSSDLYQGGLKGPLNSVNFITCHDGFTLYDLVSYNQKYNKANGEQNRDGENHNLSWNSGIEGVPASAEIERLRRRRMKTFIALLLFSQGVPMICAGDEIGRTQKGNNNSWCQDNETSWLDWHLSPAGEEILRFVQKCVGLRQQFSVFRRDQFFRNDDSLNPPEAREINWQSLLPNTQDWSADCRHLGFLLNGTTVKGPGEPSFFVMVNGDRSQTRTFITPPIPGQQDNRWSRIIDTAVDGPEDAVEPSEEFLLSPGSPCEVQPMALIMLQSV